MMTRDGSEAHAIGVKGMNRERRESLEGDRAPAVAQMGFGVATGCHGRRGQQGAQVPSVWRIPSLLHGEEFS